VVELAAWLKVDQLVAIVVEDDAGSATLTATLVDAVSGRRLAKASKAFATKDEFFERDVRGFVKTKLVAAGGGDDGGARPPGETSGTSPGDRGGEAPDGTNRSLLPGAAEQIETPGAVIGGWVLIGLAAIPVGTGIGFGIGSLNLYDGYRNKIPNQRDPQLEEVRGAWLATSLVTDISWVVAVGMIGGGAALLVSGYNEQAALEEVVTP
jgi:hypothetical protein